MGLSAGTKLGPYEIQSPLGAGGMGEVYRARDTRLGRTVAIKVLPTHLSIDPEAKQRFDREARAISSLNHPNICTLYDVGHQDGTDYLVMESLEGETLAERLREGAPPLEQVLTIATAICEALEYAHERGIVHRDLKPANVKITPEGVVKLLDFGLATALEGEVASADIASSPTLTRMATRDGIILGTAAYMSPEQARGKAADRRADIWSFGCVFYEILTGKMAFGGETVTDTLASVIKSEPDWSLLPPSTPREIRKLLQRCLKKDSKQRLQAIGDARIAIEEVISGADVDSVVPLPFATTQIWRRLLAWPVAFATCALLTGAVFLVFSFRSSHSPVMHFRAVTNFSGVQSYPALSPDGRSVAFVSNKDGQYNIYVGLINGGNPVKLTEDANLKSHPCWSPDGTEIAYGRLNDSGIWDIWKVPTLGGVPRRFLLNAADPAWSRDGRSLTYRNSATGAIWISDSFGQNGHELASTRKAGLRNSTTGLSNSAPRFSPDGREIAFATSSGGPYGELAVVNLDSGQVRQLTHDDALVLSPAWSADGRFIYFASSRGGTLNIWKIAEHGSALEQITSGQGDDAQLDISLDGKRIVFSTFRTNVNIAQFDLDAAGQQSEKLLIADAARNEYGPAYSPDGKYLAYFSNLKGVEKEGIWLANSDGSNPVPLVQDQRINIFPRWDPDSRNLVYGSHLSSSFSRSSSAEYRRISVSGGAPQTLLNRSAMDIVFDVGSHEQLLFQGLDGKVEISASPSTQTLMTLPSDINAFLFRWSPDDRSIAYIVQPGGEDDPHAGLWVHDVSNKPPHQIFRGWISWYTRGPKNELYLIQGKADARGVLWKVDWTGHGLTRVPLIIPLPFDYWFPQPFTQFDVSPDGRHMAFNTQEVLQANIGILENIR